MNSTRLVMVTSRESNDLRSMFTCILNAIGMNQYYSYRLHSHGERNIFKDT
jgi:hypothetical protein